MKTRIVYALLLFLTVSLMTCGCVTEPEPTEPPEPGYTAEQIWKQCKDAVETYFAAEFLHFSETTTMTMGDASIRVETTQWQRCDNYYAEYVQNGDYRFYRFRLGEALYTKYGDGEWILGSAEGAQTYHNLKLGDVDVASITWEFTEEEIRVTYTSPALQDGAGEHTSFKVETYVFDKAWNLLQIETVTAGPDEDATGAAASSTIERILICHDADAVTEKLDAISAELNRN